MESSLIDIPIVVITSIWGEDFAILTTSSLCQVIWTYTVALTDLKERLRNWLFLLQSLRFQKMARIELEIS